MPNTYQDLITEIQSKNPEIHQKLEGGKKFKLVTDFKPAGDQPEAIKQLVKGANKDELNQVLLGVTGSGKTFTMAQVIEKTNRPESCLTTHCRQYMRNGRLLDKYLFDTFYGHRQQVNVLSHRRICHYRCGIRVDK